MKCSYCGSNLWKGSTMCKRCGTEVVPGAEPYPAVKQQAQKAKKNNIGCAAVFLIVGVVFYIAIGRHIIAGFNEAAKDAQYNDMSESEYKSACSELTYEDIARSQDGLENKLVCFTGKVIQVSGTTYRMNITEKEHGYTDAIMFEFKDTSGPRVLEDDIVTIWGRSKGLTTYKNVIGVSVTVPDISVKYLTIKK